MRFDALDGRSLTVGAMGAVLLLFACAGGGGGGSSPGPQAPTAPTPFTRFADNGIRTADPFWTTRTDLGVMETDVIVTVLDSTDNRASFGSVDGSMARLVVDGIVILAWASEVRAEFEHGFPIQRGSRVFIEDNSGTSADGPIGEPAPSYCVAGYIPTEPTGSTAGQFVAYMQGGSPTSNPAWEWSVDLGLADSDLLITDISVTVGGMPFPGFCRIMIDGQAVHCWNAVEGVRIPTGISAPRGSRITIQGPQALYETGYYIAGLRI